MIEGERKNMPGHFSKKFFEYPSTEWADLVHFLLSVRFRSVGLQTPFKGFYVKKPFWLSKIARLKAAE